MTLSARFAVFSVIVVTLATGPAAAGAAETPKVDLAPFLDVGDYVQFKLPSADATWHVVADEAGTKIVVHEASGRVYGAVHVDASAVDVELVWIEAPAPVVPARATAIMGPSVADQNCVGTSHAYTLCADISYNNGVLWNSANTYGQGSAYYCYACLTIHGCEEALWTDCSREALFTVAGTSSGAGVCWTYGAWRSVWTNAVYDGGSVSSDTVWVGSSTSC